MILQIMLIYKDFLLINSSIEEKLDSGSNYIGLIFPFNIDRENLILQMHKRVDLIIKKKTYFWQWDT